MDFWRQKDKVATSDFKYNMGWAIVKCTFDNIFPLYCVENMPYLDECTIFDYGLFADTAAMFPLYFFKTWDEALDFTKRVSPRYPYDRLMYWLRFQREYWLSTNLIEYNDYVQYTHDAKVYFLQRNRQRMQNVIHKH